MRRSKGNSETTVSLKSDFDVKETGTIVSQDGIRENCTHVARRSDGTSRTAGMGTSCERGVHASRKEEKNILHELEEKVTKSEVNDNPNVCAGLSQKNKTELREVCKSLSILLSGQETKPQLTRKIKEVQIEREPPRQAILEFGRHGGRCYSVATAKEVRVARGTVTGSAPESDELTATEVAQSNNEAEPRGGTGRLDETSGTSASDGSTTEDVSEVRCNMKTMNEQQRTMLRKSGKQFFIDETDQLTTSEAGHTDLAEIGNVSCLEAELCESQEILDVTC